jgi:hypothetical protein
MNTGELKQWDSMRTKRRPIAIKRRSCSDSPVTAGELIRRMSLESPLWGATTIHGELLKLGIEVDQSTVSIRIQARPTERR